MCFEYGFLRAGQGVKRLASISILLVLMVAAGCATRPQESAAIRTEVPLEAVDEAAFLQSASHILPGKKDDKHTVLALSAGGADGAFGAGVLAGWTRSGNRPEFDVVTGVSTGSLLAVLAFLGPQYDPLVKKLYTSQTNATIFRSRGINGILRDSIYDNGPLKKQIEQHITAGLLKKVAAEHQKGRRLFIATTNLDAGELVVWDMGKIAMSNRPNPVQFFQKVLRASAAVPGFFPPVYIKPVKGVQLRQAHVDGGIKEPVLYAPYMANPDADESELYLVINGPTRKSNESQPVSGNIPSIAGKAILELMRELQRDTIFRHYISARGDKVKFHMTSIPDHIPIDQESLNFDPERMMMLYDAGIEIGMRGPDTWFRAPRSYSKERMEMVMRASHQ
ncbi:MAG: patatin-like phospholipase family protein [Pseudomonadota bacterium]